jgi:hypothetical protein
MHIMAVAVLKLFAIVALVVVTLVCTVWRFFPSRKGK